MKRLLLVFLLLVTGAFAQNLDLQQPLPSDPNIQFGKLESGFQYWIRRHQTPPGKVAMWLHVDAGSLHEEENQRGIAHFLEHMAFNGTEHYPPGTLVKYFESIGMRFGQHQNAFTSFDQTTYMLSLPDTKEETIRTGLMTLADFGFRITFPPEEIDQERPVILAEARARKGVGQRIMEQALPILLPGSRLAERLPIGTEEVIQKADREVFLDYYKKWYRPKDSTLLVVGDADPAMMKRLIAEEFASWKELPDPPDEPGPGIEPYTKTQAAVITDPELTTTSVSSVRVRELDRRETVGQLLLELIEDLGTIIVNRRLVALIEEGKAPYQDASVTIAPFQNQYVIQEAEASGAPEQWKPMLNSVLTELKRARDFGFLESELQDAKKALLASAEQAERTEATWDASTFLSRMNSAVSQGRKPMSEAQSLQITRDLLPRISIQQVTDAFRNSFSADSRLLMVTHPEKEGLPAPTQQEILEVANLVEASTLTPPEATERPLTLLEQEPQPGTIVETREEEETQILSAQLSNGVHIHFREMDFKKNSVIAMIRLIGGEIHETKENRGITDAAIVPFSQPATKKHSSRVIREYLTGQNVHVSGMAGGDSVVLFVSGSPDDFEEGLRLLHLLLTEPKVEDPALKVWRESTLQAIEQRKTFVESQALEERAELLSGGDPRLQYPTAEQIRAISAEEAQKWLDRVITQAPMEVAIVGDMDREKLQELALKYIGSLPKRSFKNPELMKLRNVKVLEGPLQSKIEVPTITPRAVVSIGWRGVNFPETRERRILDVAAQILTSRMQTEIREKRGLTYSVNANSTPATSYPETGFFGTIFSADPDKVTEAAQVATDMMLDFAKNGPTDAEMEAVRAQLINVLETQQKEPSYWVRVLSELDYRDIRLEDVKNLIPQITSYPKEEIRQVVAKYVQPDRRVEVIALPKVSPPAQQ
jgi:zinc protease